ncbi:hypothetical protein BLSTO_04719 [Blastocystis sp. subtype 1]
MSLEELTMRDNCLYYVNHIELKNIPNLRKIHCFNPFVYVTELHAENAEPFASFIRSKAPWCNYEQTTAFIIDQSIDVEDLTIANGAGNVVEIKELDLTALHSLQSLHIEERCFQFVKRVLIRGLQHLLTIDIDDYCFIVDYDPVEDSELCIEDCSSLDSLHIGGGSFHGYSSLQLNSMPFCEC